MISLTQIRKIDPETSSMTDEELEVIRQSFYEMGQLMFEDWQEHKFGSNIPLGSLTSLEDKDTL